MKPKPRHHEPEEHGNRHRRAFLRGVERLIERARKASAARRARFLRADFSSRAALSRSIRGYRLRLAAMLGWPLDPRLRPTPPPRFREQRVGKDDLGSITRVWIEALPGVEAYGILFRPHAPGRHALVIAQHGGGGAPELVAGFGENSANYNDMVRRLQRRGFAVFAPQLFRWSPERFGSKHDKNLLDHRLKHLGGSLAALELHLLRRWVDNLGARPEVDPRRIGMMGLSYGGFHALFAAALDPRIAASVSSCFFNQRLVYDWPDWTWFNAANTFLDAEVATLVCPRPLFIEVGRRDPMFDARQAPSEARKVAAVYRKAGATRSFVFRIHPGGHELDRGDAGMDFLYRHLVPGEDRDRGLL